MKPKQRQICLEIVSFTVGGIFLLIALFNMTVEYLATLLVVEYFVAIANTIGWLTWVDKADKNGEHKSKKRG